MDFGRLPDNVFLEIFQYLSMEERIQAGRVNKSFNRISQFIISRWTSLLFDDRFRKTNPDQLGAILELCSPNLKRADLRFPFDDLMEIQLATKFSSYECPRLTRINIGYAPIGNAVFGQLIRNAPNVEILVCNNSLVVFPDVTINKLKKLVLWGKSDDATLQSMTDRCPNLKELLMGSENFTADVLDEFLASVPRLNRLRMWSRSGIVLEDLENFWHLPLISLNVDFEPTPPGDDFMKKLSVSFPNLRHLSVQRSEATNVGVAVLADLKELEIIDLFRISTCHDEGYRQLANCKKLRKLRIWISNIRGGTMIALLRGCPKLESIGVGGIYDVHNPQEAVTVLVGLYGIVNREITIRIMDQKSKLKYIWESEAAKNAIRLLEEIEGLKIGIKW